MHQSPVTPEASVQAVLPTHVSERLLALSLHNALPLGAFVYDPAVARDTAQKLVDALPGWAQVYYAVKANTFPPLLRALAPVVAGFEVASSKEADTVADATNVPARLIASGPGKTAATLERLLADDVDLINIDSSLELHRLALLAEVTGRRPRVALRVNPNRTRLTATLSIGGQGTPFGISEEDVPSLLATARTLGGACDVVGFQFHEVCNNLDAKDHAAYVAWCLDWSQDMATRCDVNLAVVDVGGGIGVSNAGQPPFDVNLFGHHMQALSPPTGCQVLLEPGRYLVATCGYYAAEITDLKQTAGTWFAVIRGGINHFLRPALDDQNGSISVIPVHDWNSDLPRAAVTDGTVTVVGELCSPSDVLARDVVMPEVRVGDLIVFTQAGSYGWELALPTFLGHPPATRTTINELPPLASATESVPSLNGAG